jgi:hypothetical protein
MTEVSYDQAAAALRILLDTASTREHRAEAAVFLRTLRTAWPQVRDTAPASLRRDDTADRAILTLFELRRVPRVAAAGMVDRLILGLDQRRPAPQA